MKTKLMSLMLLGMLVSGCAFDSKLLENRVSCTVAKDKAFVISQYGPVGIASTIAEQDKNVICK